MTTTHEQRLELLERVAATLAELYDPAGVLMFWSSRITYLDDRRPSDLLHDGDWPTLEHLADRLDALADGTFL